MEVLTNPTALIHLLLILSVLGAAATGIQNRVEAMNNMLALVLVFGILCILMHMSRATAP